MDGSTREMYEPAGTPRTLAVSSVHAPPSFIVFQRRPSSVPTIRCPARSGDSSSETIVPNVSARVASVVMPPVVVVEMRSFTWSA